ncbi:hypothetical protein [Streptomyces sp. SID12501]|uniref:Uncharacterized protein n=1 Tax=Streptomyces sp. SID12501 TaxID=2706042 RepID=A0A6B3BWJ6_9ACTN|nr:hypothetical protein [Streptomyces sp. SID12501]NEC88733.1 hypothetical protein [Streptomyces sp. SID12501]
MVPSYGFDLGPVLAHCLAARRQWRVRRTVLVAVLGWIAYRFPLGVALWAFTVALALAVAWPPRRTLWRARPRRSRFSRTWGGAIAMVLLPSLVMLFRPTSRVAGETLAAVEFAALAYLGVRIVDRLVAVVYALVCDRGGRDPWTGPRLRGRITAIERAQNGNALPYELDAGYWRFIGAGNALWRRATISIKLQGEKDDEDEEIRKDYVSFDTDELLTAVSQDLEDLRIAEPPSRPLECEVRYVRGGPSRRWARLSKNPSDAGAEGDAGTDADEYAQWGRSPDEGGSENVVRHYLSAQVETWSGQLVITVLASAVIEGQELHFVVRPHVLPPLFDDIEEAVDPEVLRRITTFAQIPVQAVGDLVALGHGWWQFFRWWARESEETASGEQLAKVPKRPMPTSLRERYTPVYTDDMHVSEDAVRHVTIVQSSMFSTVEDFLELKGVDVTEFKRQVQKIMTVIHAGDNNIIQTVTAGRDARDVRQGADAAHDRQASRPADRDESDKATEKGDGE